MEFQVRLCSKEDMDCWMFDEEADAKAFYDDFDSKALVLHFGRYDDKNEVFEVFESKCIDFRDVRVI